MSIEPLSLKNLLDDLRIDMVTGNFTQCGKEWRRFNEKPPFNRFYFILDGEGELVVNRQVYHPRKNQLWLMPAGKLHSYYSISDHCFLKYWCHFTASLGEENLFDVIRTPLYVDVDPDDTSYLTGLFQKLLQASQNAEVDFLLRKKAAMLEIVAYFLSKCPHIDFVENQNPQFFALLTCIKENLSHHFTIEELAGQMHMHPNYFIKYFRKAVGIPPMQYINSLRIDRASELLKSSDASIAQVAAAVGFGDGLYFSRVFKKAIGCSPKTYRNLC